MPAAMGAEGRLVQQKKERARGHGAWFIMEDYYRKIWVMSFECHVLVIQFPIKLLVISKGYLFRMRARIGFGSSLVDGADFFSLGL